MLPRIYTAPQKPCAGEQVERIGSGQAAVAAVAPAAEAVVAAVAGEAVALFDRHRCPSPLLQGTTAQSGLLPVAPQPPVANTGTF